MTLDWRELEHELVAECRIFSVERSLAVSPHDGTTHDFYRIRTADWVQIVPVTPDREVVLVRQYRHGSQSATLEIPGGLVEPGEAPAAAALRECLEETGYRGVEARDLGVVSPNPALFANRLHGFYVENVERVAEAQNFGSEHTTVELVPVAALEGMLLRGEIDHALVVAALWRYLRIVHE
jgi:ADP-ribose pyrophosphatase